MNGVLKQSPGLNGRPTVTRKQRSRIGGEGDNATAVLHHTKTTWEYILVGRKTGDVEHWFKPLVLPTGVALLLLLLLL